MSENGETLFVKPCEEEMDFGEFVEFVRKQEEDGGEISEVKYAQTRSWNFLYLTYHIPNLTEI